MTTVFTNGQIASTIKTAYAWTGDANASASVETRNAVVLRRNLAVDPAAKSGANWGSYAPGTSITTTLQADAIGVPVSTYIRGTFAGASQYAGGGLYHAGLSIAGAGTYSASVWVRVSARQRMIVILEWSGGSAAGSYVDVEANTWTRITATRDVPAGVSSVNVSIYAGNGGFGYARAWAAGDTLDATALLLEAAADPTAYFDGASVGSTVVNYVSARPLVVSAYEAAREVRNVFNPVLGAQATVAAAFPAGLRSGTMTAVFTSQADALSLDGMLAGTAVITMSDSDLASVGMTFLARDSIRVYAAEDRSVVNGVETLFWMVEFGYQEVTV